MLTEGLSFGAWMINLLHFFKINLFILDKQQNLFVPNWLIIPIPNYCNPSSKANLQHTVAIAASAEVALKSQYGVVA